jgi:glycosyltransferase involved in cell wall biosynthesis
MSGVGGALGRAARLLLPTGGRRFVRRVVLVWERLFVNRRYRGDLQRLRDRAGGTRGVIVFLPSVGWNTPLTQRPHHLAREFARHGYLTVFESRDLADGKSGLREVEPNIFLYRGPEAVLARLPAPILWAFPYNFYRRDVYPVRTRIVYDWIDDLEIVPHDRAYLKRRNSQMLREATVVTAAARRLLEKALEIRPDAMYLPNAVDVQRFSDPTVAVPDDPALARLKAEGKPIAGYYGAMADWLDTDLLEAVATLRPDWNFLLIGPAYHRGFDSRAARLLARPNVIWLGPRPYESLPGYLKLFDVATIPFRINDITRGTSPLKLYEYFAAAKPVVTTDLPECRAYPEVQIGGAAEEFSEALDAARAEGARPEFRARLQAIARENSWEARVTSVLPRLGRSASAV